LINVSLMSFKIVLLVSDFLCGVHFISIHTNAILDKWWLSWWCCLYIIELQGWK